MKRQIHIGKIEMISFSSSNLKDLIIHVSNESDLFLKHSERDRIIAAVKQVYFAEYGKNVRVNKLLGAI